MPENADPVQQVKDFLSTVERRDLAAAQAMLAPGFYMIFPGGHRFESLEQLVAWARQRYARAQKVYERFDVVAAGEGTSVIYCYGTLFGEFLSGERFSGIRFIDRFTVSGGRLVDQQVWNDMAEVRDAKLNR
jgi:limonene-1,2-epoxide hydrolase